MFLNRFDLCFTRFSIDFCNQHPHTAAMTRLNHEHCKEKHDNPEHIAVLIEKIALTFHTSQQTD